MTRSTIALTGLLLAHGAVAFAASHFNLDFDAPVPGTIADADGLGTGLLVRLPNTGGAIPANDPNLSLSAVPGRLVMQSTNSNLGGPLAPGGQLPTAEALGVYVPGVGSQDVVISSGFRNVHVPNGSDQVSVFAGLDAGGTVRAAIHEQNRFILSVNDGTGDVNTYTALDSFATGDDLDVSLFRHAGLWGMSWHNLTTDTYGSLPGVSVPWLDAHSNLYFGIHAADAGTPNTFQAQFDYFSVNVVPEPGTTMLLLVGVLCLGASTIWHRLPRIANVA